MGRLRPVYSDTTKLNSTSSRVELRQRSVYSDTTQLDVELSRIELRRYKRAFRVGVRVVPIFTARKRRDPMRSADYAIARCLSVCPFITRQYSVETDFFLPRVVTSF